MKLQACVGFIPQVVSVMLSREYMAFLLPSTAKKLDREKFSRLRKMFDWDTDLIQMPRNEEIRAFEPPAIAERNERRYEKKMNRITEDELTWRTANCLPVPKACLRVQRAQAGRQVHHFLLLAKEV